MCVWGGGRFLCRINSHKEDPHKGGRFMGDQYCPKEEG